MAAAAAGAALPKGSPRSAPPRQGDAAAYENSKPIREIPEKWKLLRAFLETRGLVKQHIDSFNFFVQTDIKKIVKAKANCLVQSDVDPQFYLRYTDVRVGKPSVSENMRMAETTPTMCRRRDLTYAAPIIVDVEYMRGREIVKKNGTEIGRMPVMLRSSPCVLHKKSAAEMERLGECPYDPGGYFVVKGTEKVILMQEQLSKNRVIVELDPKGLYCAWVQSASAESKSRTTVVLRNNRLCLRHNSFSEDIPVCIALKAMGLETDQEAVQMVGTKRHHLDSMALAIQEAHDNNVLTQAQALNWISGKLRHQSRMGGGGKGWGGQGAKMWPQGGGGMVRTQERSRDEDRDGAEALEILHRVVLSHIHCHSADFLPKIRFLCVMIRRLLDAKKDPTLLDDKDYFGNKRLELAGALLALLFEDLFKKFNADLKKQIDLNLSKHMEKLANQSQKSRERPDYPDAFRHPNCKTITDGLVHALSSGNWNIKRFRMERAGVSQVLNRLSYVASVGMMTRVSSQFEKARKVSGPRALQPSQWGVLCPCDTPEGEACGLVKNLALMTHITVDEESGPLIRLCFSLGVEPASSLGGEEIHSPGTFAVFLNGDLLGLHRRPQQFMRAVRLLRRMGRIGEFVSIFENTALQAVFISSDGGRLCRPLITVEKGKPRLQRTHMEALEKGESTFFDFLRSGILEWIDVNEENNALIALTEKDVDAQTTHMEVDPLTILGAVAGLIPYPNHNQSPRNTYQCAMGKQAMGAIAHNQFERTDTLLYLLVYPQKPLVKTRTMELMSFDHLPAGQNASLAIMSYSAYDIEDATIMNKASLDRGFGRSICLRRYNVPLNRNYPNGAMDVLMPPPAPPADQGAKGEGPSGRAHFQNLASRKQYEALDEDGIARVGEMVSDDQIYANRHVPVRTVEGLAGGRPAGGPGGVPHPATMRRSAVKYKVAVPAYVDRVILAEDEGGDTTLKFMFRQTRRPEIGDKFSSRHGQKGVIGLIVGQEDFPFAESGWCPDMIMNPHGFPSRMTVGKMMELIAGKSAVFDGMFKYGTIFGGTKIEDVSKVLLEHGYSYSGKEYLTSGITGEALETYIFVGPVFYQRLKHMVQDKIHARGRGPRVTLTHQPTEGRAKDGGLRLGEMERDCLVAYGASNLLIERLMLSSDLFEASICAECGLLGYCGFCPFCKSAENVCSVNLPYACKLLFQELQAMNVCPRLSLKPK